jgi:hypothetical protein
MLDLGIVLFLSELVLTDPDSALNNEIAASNPACDISV